MQPASTRAVILLCPLRFRARPISSQFRLASNSSHPHEEFTDHGCYAPEGGFFTPFWRNTLLLSLLAVSFYKWAPPRNEDAYLTRWIAHYSTPSDTWARLNQKHLWLSQESTDNVNAQAKATRPGIIRYRYPQSLEQASPHLQPVGSTPDISGVKARMA